MATRARFSGLETPVWVFFFLSLEISPLNAHLGQIRPLQPRGTREGSDSSRLPSHTFSGSLQ